MSDMNVSLRRLTLTMLAALLILTAGCTGPGLDGTVGSDTVEENTETPEEITPEDGIDLRTISFNYEFDYIEERGELDGADPRQNNKVYEPVEFVGQEGRYYNITMESNYDAEEIRLIDPDGKVVAVETGDSEAPARFELLRLNKTGKYTIHATSIEERTTFTYTLTIDEVAYAGDPEKEWGEFERYSQYGGSIVYFWDQQARHSNATFEGVNTSEDYVVISYERDEDANYTVQNSDYTFMARTLIDVRDYIATNPDGLQRENPEEWYPDRVYFKGYNEEGELVQTNYVHQRWAELFEESGNTETRKYFYKVVGTTKYGPAHNKYDDSEANETIEEETFPYPTYNESYVDFPTE